MQERWCDVKNYEGIYQVSSYGNVKNVQTGKQLKPMNDGRYLFVQLWKCGKYKDIKVHRLVAIAFIPNIKNLPEINHIDENKHNNHVDNLEWCTHSHNMKNNNLHKKIGEKIRKKWERKEYRDRLAIAHGAKPFRCVETGVIYYNKTDCKKELGANRRSVIRVLNGEQEKANGYHFEYV